VAAVDHRSGVRLHGTANPDGGNLETRTLTFTEYGSQSVSENFRPETVDGTHWVRLWIEGLNMQAWEYQVRYRIDCE
jgi:hypothetical protein